MVYTDKLNSLIDEVESNNEIFSSISDRIIYAYTSDLDSLMKDFRVDVVENDPSDAVLEKYALELSNMLYFMGQRLEGVGIKEDLSKIIAKEVYNNAYLQEGSKVSPKKPTVAELTATAEGASQYELILSNLYSRAYKQIKFKIDAGYEVLGTVKKIISKRIQDSQNSSFGGRSYFDGSEEKE